MKVAVGMKLPLILHIREADDDALKLIRENVPKEHFIHLHCYTSTPPFATTLVQEYPNAYIGFTGAVTFKNSKQIQETVKLLPIERLLLETDAPYMAPIPFRFAFNCSISTIGSLFRFFSEGRPAILG